MRYLYVIFKNQKDETAVRPVNISRELGVSKASVSRMMKLLAGMDLILVKEHGGVTLTPKGRAEGMQFHNRVTRLYPFFADYLKLDCHEALESTLSFLCGFSDICVEKLLTKGWAADQTAL